MTAVELSQLLLLYSWFALAALLVFLLLIARFYQRSFQERTHFRWFVLPGILFGMAAVRFAGVDQVAGDILGDLLTAAAGVILIVLSISLVRQMMRGSRPTKTP